MRITITDTQIRMLEELGYSFTPAENRIGQHTDHHFAPGDRVRLVGLETFPEYNGELVEITNFREDGEAGRAYYIKGRINAHLNWVYEYRLERIAS